MRRQRPMRTEAMLRVRMRSYMVLRLTPRRSAASSTDSNSLVAGVVIIAQLLVVLTSSVRVSGAAGLFADDVGVLAGSGGGGVGEDAVAFGEPTVAGVGPFADDEHGLVVLVVGQVIEDVCEVWALLAEALQVVPAAPLGSLAASFREGGGVGAGLGQEVTAEAEHVRPLAEPAVGRDVAGLSGELEGGGAAEAPGGGEEPAGVRGLVGVG